MKWSKLGEYKGFIHDKYSLVMENRKAHKRFNHNFIIKKYNNNKRLKFSMKTLKCFKSLQPRHISCCIYYNVPIDKMISNFGINSYLTLKKVSKQCIITIPENVKPVNNVGISSQVSVKLAVTFHHGEEEGAQTDPGAVAVLLRLPA